MKQIKLKVVSKGEFYDLLKASWLNDNKDYTQEDLFNYFVEYGFPNLDWEDLSKCLPKMGIHVDTVAVDIGNSEFLWVVSGRTAMLINKKDVGWK